MPARPRGATLDQRRQGEVPAWDNRRGRSSNLGRLGLLRSRLFPDERLEVRPDDVLHQRLVREALLGIGGDDLSPEELPVLSEARPVTIPWDWVKAPRPLWGQSHKPHPSRCSTAVPLCPGCPALSFSGSLYDRSRPASRPAHVPGRRVSDGQRGSHRRGRGGVAGFRQAPRSRWSRLLTELTQTCQRSPLDIVWESPE